MNNKKIYISVLVVLLVVFLSLGSYLYTKTSNTENKITQDVQETEDIVIIEQEPLSILEVSGFNRVKLRNLVLEQVALNNTKDILSYEFSYYSKGKKHKLNIESRQYIGVIQNLQGGTAKPVEEQVQKIQNFKPVAVELIYVNKDNPPSSIDFNTAIDINYPIKDFTIEKVTAYYGQVLEQRYRYDELEALLKDGRVKPFEDFLVYKIIDERDPTFEL